MPPGPDGDDEELVEIDVENVEIDGPPPVPRQPTPDERPSADAAPELVGDEPTEPNRDPGEPAPPLPVDLLEISDAVELQPPLVEAAEEAPEAARELYQAEAAVAEGGRRSALLGEVSRLAETSGAAEGSGALEAARAAFESDPASVRALWVLRRLLTEARRWDELEAALQQAASAQGAAAVDPVVRADLLVERGRLCEDRLERPGDGVACYREALAAAPDHPGALLALVLAAARQQDAALEAEALGGLARRAVSAPRRAALVIEEAVARRRSGAPDGPARAFEALEGELQRADAAAPLGPLLRELDVLTRAGIPADTAVRALDLAARRIAGVDPGLAVALERERARLLREALGAPEAALDVLDGAARIDPAHPLVAADRIALALALGRLDAADEVVRAFVVAAGDDDEAVDLALRSEERR